MARKIKFLLAVKSRELVRGRSYLDAEELGGGALELAVQRGGAELGARAGQRQPVAARGRLGRVRARARRLREAQVVVGAEVDAAPLRAREAERPVVVVGGALLERELGARRGADGPVEQVPHAPVHVAREELLEGVVQRRVALQHERKDTLVGY